MGGWSGVPPYLKVLLRSARHSNYAIKNLNRDVLESVRSLIIILRHYRELSIILGSGNAKKGRGAGSVLRAVLIRSIKWIGNAWRGGEEKTAAGVLSITSVTNRTLTA